MSNPVYPPPASSNEINLTEAFIKLVKLLRKHIIWVIFFPLAGLAGGYFITPKAQTIYDAKVMFRSRILGEREMAFLAQNYQNAGMPGLTPEEKAYIRGISFDVTKEQPHVLAVAKCVIVDNPAIASRVGEAFKQTVENEPDVRKLTDNFKKLNSALAAEYTETIRKGQAMLERQDPSFNYKNPNSFPDLVEVYEKRQEVLVLLQDSAAINVVAGFGPELRTGRQTKAMMVGLLMGTVALMLFLGIIYLADHYRKYSASA